MRIAGYYWNYLDFVGLLLLSPQFPMQCFCGLVLVFPSFFVCCLVVATFKYNESSLVFHVYCFVPNNHTHWFWSTNLQNHLVWKSNAKHFRIISSNRLPKHLRSFQVFCGIREAQYLVFYLNVLWNVVWMSVCLFSFSQGSSFSAYGLLNVSNVPFVSLLM